MAADSEPPPVAPGSVGGARYTAAKFLLEAWRVRAGEWSRAACPPSEEEVEELAADMRLVGRLVRGMIREDARRG